MTGGIRVRTGTVGKGTPQERRAAWVETALTLYPEVHDLADGLGSEYLRYAITEDDELESDRPKGLPVSLTQREILRVYREQVEYRGVSTVSTWGDDMSTRRQEACAKWLTEIVLNAFPGMKGYEFR